MSVEARLDFINLEMPLAAVGRNQWRVQVGALCLFSGELSFVDGKIVQPGHVGAEVGVQPRYAAVRICALNSLAQIRAAIISSEQLQAISRVEEHVNCAPGFMARDKVLGGATDLFLDALGERSGHVRTACTMSRL